MKIAIPMVDGVLCSHFGHCEKFTIMDVDSETKKIIERNDVVPPPHEPGLLPRWLADKNVKVVIAGGMGQRAQSLFNEKGVKVIVGAPSKDPESLVMSYLNGSLTLGANICDH